jgi:hypothetical protein
MKNMFFTYSLACSEEMQLSSFKMQLSLLFLHVILGALFSRYGIFFLQMQHSNVILFSKLRYVPSR